MKYLRQIERKTKRQNQESNSKNGIGNKSPQGDDRISIIEMVWALKTGGERYPKMSWQASIQGKRPKGRS
jgi:hypothetical protein